MSSTNEDVEKNENTENQKSTGDKDAKNAEVKNNPETKTTTTAEVADYVVVQDDEGSEPMELPVSGDNTLGITTLTHAFPGAHGLKYRNPKTGASRALAMDASGNRFMAPPDGWADKVFTVIFPPTARGAGEAKRRKVDDGSDSEEDEGAAKQKRLEDPNKPVDLIVLGVNYSTSQEGFKAHFEEYGKVVAADLKVNYEGKSKGFGFVLMQSIEDQNKVLSAAPHMIDGRKVEVKIPDQRSENFRNPVASSSEVRSNKVFIGRLPETTTEELRSFFEEQAKNINPHAVITDVFLPRPFRGFGFVTFSTCEMARKIVQANNLTMKGSPLACSLAVPRESSTNDGSFGYSYGYGANNEYRKRGADNREPMGPGGSYYGYGAPMPSGGYGMGGPFSGSSSGYSSEYNRYGNNWSSGRPSSSSSRFPPSPSSNPPPHLLPGPSNVPPPRILNTSSPPMNSHVNGPIPLMGTAPSTLANNLDALNLGRNDVFGAAWAAFMHTLKNGGQRM